MDSYKDALFGESPTNPDRNPIVSRDSLHGYVYAYKLLRIELII